MGGLMKKECCFCIFQNYKHFTSLPKMIDPYYFVFILCSFSSFYWQKFIIERECELNPQLKIGIMQFSKYSLESNIVINLFDRRWCHPPNWSNQHQPAQKAEEIHYVFILEKAIGFFETWMRLRLAAWRWRWYNISNAKKCWLEKNLPWWLLIRCMSKCNIDL